MHLICRRLVLDQLEHPVAEHDGAFGRCQILPNSERILISKRDNKIAVIRL